IYYLKNFRIIVPALFNFGINKLSLGCSHTYNMCCLPTILLGAMLAELLRAPRMLAEQRAEV
uniref:Uncharacterized protein n=1 Tax=Romanomermis culicivorax TaxID=13658 RepID=A0A915IVR1_ROMCU